jgi:uncharacterized membrane protein
MPPGHFWTLYALTVAVLTALDMVWLGLAAKTFYRRQLGHLTADRVGWPAALLFYLLYAAGLLTFAVLPREGSGPIGQTAFSGALFGLFAYSTYDLTNLATLRKWPVLVTVVDILWGTTLSAVVSSVAWAAAGHLR